MRKETLRTLVRGAYEIQKLRIQAGNRIVANWKVKAGQTPGEKEDVMDDEGKKLLQIIRLSYTRITDGLVNLPTSKRFTGDGVIDDYTELCLVSQYITLEKQEKEHFAKLRIIIQEHPLWKNFLVNVRGVGPAMASVIISELDPHKAKYPSSFWKFCGLDVCEDGKGRSRRKEHLRTIEYTNKEGKPAERQGITFNPFIKTKMMGVLASSFLRAGGEYADIYNAYKTRLMNHPVHAEKTKIHRHNMAMRYMCKCFLLNLHMAWRKLEGLPVSVPYAEAKLGLKHGKDVA